MSHIGRVAVRTPPRLSCCAAHRETALRRSGTADSVMLGRRRRDLNAEAYEVEFHWKEEVVYWEGRRGYVFPVMALAEVPRGCSSNFPTWGWGGWGQASHPA